MFQNNLTELKSFGSPPAAVVNVTAAVMVLLANKQPKIPKDRSWKAAKVMMGKVGVQCFLSKSFWRNNCILLVFIFLDQQKIINNPNYWYKKTLEWYAKHVMYSMSYEEDMQCAPFV